MQKMTTSGITVLIVVVVVLAVVAVLLWYLARERRSKRLRSRFGPEYDDTVRETGSRPAAEQDLARREKRVEKIHVHSLSRDERDRFAQEWHDVQARFVDDPPGSIDDADRLVCDVMRSRGYPMSDFDHRAEDLSVDHPYVVRNYRAAHDIALRHEKGQASTEDLRQALVYYRDLFDDLLEAHNFAGPRGTRR
jgi:hypothetical protein